MVDDFPFPRGRCPATEDLLDFDHGDFLVRRDPGHDLGLAAWPFDHDLPDLGVAAETEMQRLEINPSTKFPDGWAGYQTEWKALKEFINAHGIRGVVFISGDLHLGAIDNGAAAGFPEMCVAAVNTEQVDHCSTSPTGPWSEG